VAGRHAVARPVNWQCGNDVIIEPSLSDEAARARFPGATPLPHLRVVKQPLPEHPAIWTAG
jgi:hypothetical protein